MPSDLLHGFRVGPWKVEPLKGTITGPDNESCHLQPKVMDVLVCLAARADEPVTRDELLEEVWGENTVSDEPLTRAIGELRRALLDDRGHPQFIKTIPKRGYRLIGEVHLREPVSLEKDVDPDEPITHVTGRRLRLIIMSLLCVAVILLVYDKWWTPDPPERSIAVLPFENMSGSMEQEYFSDGITEEILNALAMIQGLKVTSRTSAFYFEGKEVPVPEIAETLGVAYILEGSVRKSADRLRITAQLFDASNGYHLWSNTWDRTLTDVFAIQDEIAAAVAESLRVTLLDELPKAQRTDPEAYSLFLKSKVPLRHFTTEGFEEASRLLMQALAIDPEYAAAWGQLAINQTNQALWKKVSPEEGYARAEASARRALSLDLNNVQALIVLGAVELFWSWDFEAAREWFNKAREVTPGDPPTNAYAYWTGYLGRAEAALALYQEASDRDPLNLIFLANLAEANIGAGRFDTARLHIEAMKQIDPESARIPEASGWLEWTQGNFEEALLHSYQMEYPQVLRACALYGLGRFSESKVQLDELQRREIPHAFDVADIYACWGDKDRAFEWLERAYEEHDPSLLALRRSETMLKLHDDPRWEALLQKLGLSDEHAEKLGL